MRVPAPEVVGIPSVPARQGFAQGPDRGDDNASQQLRRAKDVQLERKLPRLGIDLGKNSYWSP